MDKIKYTYIASKDKLSGLWGVDIRNIKNGGIGVVYESQFNRFEARRIVACLITWDQIRDYVEFRTNIKPKRNPQNEELT